MAPESDFKMDLSNVLPPGSSTRLEVIEIIASSAKFKDADARKTFFRNSALADYADSFDLSGGSQEFAERILPDLLDIGKLDLFLQWLLETDKSLNPERKQFLKKEVLKEDQSERKSEIRQMRAAAAQPNPASIALEHPKKLDKQVLVRHGLSKPDQIPKIIELVELGQARGVFSVFLEGNRRITKEYIASRIILELREQQGIAANIQNEIYVGDMGGDFSESIAKLNKKLEDIKTCDIKNQCFIFLLSCSCHFPKVVESNFETFLNHQCIQSLQAKQDCCFMFIWIFDRSPFTKTQIKKLEKQITHFPIYKIVLKSFQNVIRRSFDEVGLCDRLDECFEKLDEFKGEFFPTYEYMDETFVNPSIY